MSKPCPQFEGVTFVPVPEFDDVTVGCGAPRSAYFDRHVRTDVPREFKDKVRELFFSGGRIPDFAPDIDRDKAARAIKALLRSFEPSHEAKEETVAYALWVWSTPADERDDPRVNAKREAR